MPTLIALWAALSLAQTAAPPPVGTAPAPARRRIFIDPGHGAPGNPGNTNSACQDEQDIMLGLAQQLGPALVATGAFEVRHARTGDERPGYWDRVHAAADWGADVFLSLHSDARGTGRMETQADGRRCPVSLGARGFSVLWSDEGTAELVAQRRALARALGRALSAQGFVAYDGADYAHIYGADAEVPGVFVDRHTPQQRILVLRRPTMASVIVETHHAWDPAAVAEWATIDTQARFHRAMAEGLRPGP